MEQPSKTSLKKMGEKVTSADRAILAYRTHCYDLKLAAGQEE
jgi:hypothetical protein